MNKPRTLSEAYQLTNKKIDEALDQADSKLMEVFMAIKYGEIDFKTFKSFVDSYKQEPKSEV